MVLADPLRALVAVVRRQPDPEFPLADVARLDAAGRADLLSLLHRHSLSGWAHAAFRRAGLDLPDDIADPLRAAHAANTGRGIVELAAYERLSGVLSAAGIDHAPLKGLRLLATLYPDPGARALSDIDILVREADVDRADAALRAAGYGGEAPDPWRRQRRCHHHHGYDAPPPFAVHAEVHWRLSSTFGVRRDPARLWEETSPAPGAATGSRERVLWPLPQIHGLLVHAATHGYAASLKWLLDLRLLFADPASAPAAPAAKDPSDFAARGRGGPGGGEALGAEQPPGADDLLRRARETGSVGACGFALGLVAHVAGSAAARPHLEAVLSALPAPRRAALAMLSRPEWFLDRAAILRRKWPAHALGVWLCDGAPDRARAATKSVLYKLDLEGFPVPEAVARWADGRR